MRAVVECFDHYPRRYDAVVQADGQRPPQPNTAWLSAPPKELAFSGSVHDSAMAQGSAWEPRVSLEFRTTRIAAGASPRSDRGRIPAECEVVQRRDRMNTGRFSCAR